MASDYSRYHYDGPIYYNGHKISASSNLFTMARSYAEARRNLIFKVANGDIVSRYDLDDSLIIRVDDEKLLSYDSVEDDYCEKCGIKLTHSKECPVCDFQEYDLIEAFSELNKVED